MEQTKGYGSVFDATTLVVEAPPSQCDPPPTKCNDGFWGGLFGLNCIVLLALCLGYHEGSAQTSNMINVLVLALPLSLVSYTLLTWTIAWNPYIMIQSSLILPALGWACAAAGSLFTGALGTSLICTLFTAFSVCWFFAVQQRVRPLCPVH